MSITLILDILLTLLLVGYLLYGYRAGLLRSIFPIVGVIVGGIAGFLLLPVLTSIVPDPAWRVVASILLVLGLIAVGNSLGALLGAVASRVLVHGPLRLVDRLLGSIVTVVVAALVTSMVASGVGSLGVPFLTAPIADSAVLRTIGALTPGPVKGAMAQLRSLVIDDGIPRITEALGGPRTPPPVPDVDTGGDALQKASRSVVRISGNAYACGQSQTGSGFVVAPGRILTNAHVVSGVDEPVVETPQDGTAAARVVYFDPVDDLAVLAVDGLGTPPLPLSATLPPTSPAVVDGYPLGGPFTSEGAQVMSVETFDVADIYGDSETPRNVYTLAANVQQGNSGGPLLTTVGQVAGLVFAKSADTANVGYAMTMEELSPCSRRRPCSAIPSRRAAASGVEAERAE
ncbi:MarP family serine protease [Naasia aerilata]|uniref:Serine protease n=1 Tax=Naasia aerilata TaxID=1162966 RepID=A0ABN6XRM6_9MICO|nr:MarP family serine protease [Naasia aerilata]BDZ47636.1 serine protease [Naasia aerilata]